MSSLLKKISNKYPTRKNPFKMRDIKKYFCLSQTEVSLTGDGSKPVVSKSSVVSYGPNVVCVVVVVFTQKSSLATKGPCMASPSRSPSVSNALKHHNISRSIIIDNSITYILITHS